MCFYVILTAVRRLAIRPGAIGDFVVSLPALESLRAETTHFELWTAGPNVPLARFPDCTRSILSTGLDLLELGQAGPDLIETLGGFDSIVSWYGTNRPDFRDLVQSLGLPFTFFPALPPADWDAPAAEFYLEQVRTICDLPSDGIPRIACQTTRENFAVIHPFSGSAKKNWPLTKFQSLARQLERTMPVRWCAGPDDPPLENAVRMQDLYDLACWLSRARLYIGNDSGITHLAAAVGTPVLAIFGSSRPEVWAPRGPNVRVSRFIP